jgi:hypothetical protein
LPRAVQRPSLPTATPDPSERRFKITASHEALPLGYHSFIPGWPRRVDPVMVRNYRDNHSMAKRTIVQLEDDLDGGEADRSVAFSLNGDFYEIDLNSANADKLAETLAPYINAARRVSGRARSGRGVRRPAGVAVDTYAVREWAKGQGLKVSDRGRVSAEVQAAYVQAH